MKLRGPKEMSLKPVDAKLVLRYAKARYAPFSFQF